MRLVIDGHVAFFSGIEVNKRDDAAVKAHEFPNVHLVYREPEDRFCTDGGAKFVLFFADEIEVTSARKNGIDAGLILFGNVLERRVVELCRNAALDLQFFRAFCEKAGQFFKHLQFSFVK